MSERAPYSRVYWSILDDEKFDTIRDDMRHLGSWNLLLVVADMAWPVPAFVPATIPKASFRALVASGLVDPLSGGRFRLHGLDAERNRRRDIARSGGKRDPNGRQTGPVRYPNEPQDETRRDETRTSIARDGLANLDGAALDALESRTGHVASVAGDKQLNEYDRLIGDHGLVPVLAAFDAVSDGKRMTARQLVWGAVKLLEPFADPKLAEKREREAAVAATSRRSVENTQRYLRDLRGEAS